MGARRESAVAMKARATKESGSVSRERQVRPSPQQLDRVIHDRTRLAILAALAGSETQSFTDLKAITGTPDGNLSVHARRLEDAGYVLCEKTFAGPDYVRRTIDVAQKLLQIMERQKIPVGIGVHSGVAYFGSLATAEGLTDISAKGEEVNMTARLASKAGVGEIIVSEPALQAAGIDNSDLEARSLELKGLSEPVNIRVMNGS